MSLVVFCGLFCLFLSKTHNRYIGMIGDSFIWSLIVDSLSLSLSDLSLNLQTSSAWNFLGQQIPELHWHPCKRITLFYVFNWFFATFSKHPPVPALRYLVNYFSTFDLIHHFCDFVGFLPSPPSHPHLSSLQIEAIQFFQSLSIRYHPKCSLSCLPCPSVDLV